jgi:hypothetical protein
LIRNAAGKIEREELDRWMRSRPKDMQGRTKGGRPPKTDAPHEPERPQASIDGEVARMARAALEITLSEGGLFASQSDAQLARDSYQARLKQLEYEEKSGRLVEADEVQRDAAAVYAMVRTRIMAVPTHVAPTLARLRTAPEVEDVLRAALTEILEELAQTIAAKV